MGLFCRWFLGQMSTCLKIEAQSALEKDPNLPEIYYLLVTHTSQGSLSTVMLMSSLLAVSKSCPMIVMMVPPAAGPLEGDTAKGTGSLKMGRKLLLWTFAHLQLTDLMFSTSIIMSKKNSKSAYKEDFWRITWHWRLMKIQHYHE